MLLGSWGKKTILGCLDYIQEIKLGGTANPDIMSEYKQFLSKHTEREIGLVAGAVTVVDEDGERARELARKEVALYLPVIAELDTTVSIDEDVMQGIATAAKEFDFATAATYIDDVLLSKFAFAGTPDDIVSQSLALFRAGTSVVEFGTPHGLQSERGIDLLGTQVLPAIREGLSSE